MLNILNLTSYVSTIISITAFNALLIPLLTPVALNGIKVKNLNCNQMVLQNLIIFGLGGLITPFAGVKLISILISGFIK